MSLLLSRANVRPSVRLLSSPQKLAAPGISSGTALSMPFPRRSSPPARGLLLALRATQGADAEAEARPERSVFDGVDRSLRALQTRRGGVPEEAVGWATRMRNALARYRAAEGKLAAAFAKSERDRAREDVRFEPLRRQVRTALQVVRSMCDQAHGRVPQAALDHLEQEALWSALQQAMAWRRRELAEPLRSVLAAPKPRAYTGALDHLKRRLRPLMNAQELDPKLKAWAYKLRQTLVEEYVFLEVECRKLEAKRARVSWEKLEQAQASRLPVWRADAIRDLQEALAEPRDAEGGWKPGFEGLARAPRLCALLKTCQNALALRTCELDPAWARDIS